LKPAWQNEESLNKELAPISENKVKKHNLIEARAESSKTPSSFDHDRSVVS